LGDDVVARAGEKWAIWNTLHDGEIVSATGCVPGDVVMEVEVGYLCKMLATASDRLSVRLVGCRSLRIEPHGGEPSSDPQHLAGHTILSAGGSARGTVSIECVSGSVQLEYVEVTTRLAEGAVITQTELEAAAERYWTEWEEKHQR
jgi:hypothetical protein